MRCNLSKKRLMDTLVFDVEKLYSEARFESYRVTDNLVYKSSLEDGHDSIQAAFMAGYYFSHIATVTTIRERLTHYLGRLKKIEIKRSLKRIKDIKGGSLW